MRTRANSVRLLVALAIGPMIVVERPATAQTVRLIDAHSHDMADKLDAAGVPITAAVQVERFREAGLGGSVIISHNPRVLQEYAAIKAADFVVYPFINVPRAASGGASLTAAIVQTIKDTLNARAACGVGELPLRQDFPSGTDDSTPLNHPLLSQIYQLADERDVPVLMHVQVPRAVAQHACDGARAPGGTVAAEMVEMLSAHPGTSFVFAHANVDAPACFGRWLLAAFPNALLDIAGRVDPGGRALGDPAFAETRIVADDGRLLDEWRDLLETFPHRIMFGLDVGPPVNRYNYLTDLIAQSRSLLEQLSPGAAQHVAHATLQRVVRGCR